MKAVFIILLALAIVAAIPFISVWALNTLFGHIGLEIPYTIETWLASILLNVYFATPFYRNSK
jgi:uncharacterized RDD family membrane protein YckC